MNDSITLELRLEGGDYLSREEIYEQIYNLLSEAGEEVSIEKKQSSAPPGSQIELVTVSLVVGIVAASVKIVEGIIGIIKDVSEMIESKQKREQASDANQLKMHLNAKDFDVKIELSSVTEEEIDQFAIRVTSG